MGLIFRFFRFKSFQVTYKVQCLEFHLMEVMRSEAAGAILISKTEWKQGGRPVA